MSKLAGAEAGACVQLSDLRDSGSPDSVVFIYREELYDAGRDAQGSAELHIAKQRSGPLGIVPVQFDAPTTRFGNLLRR